MFHKPKIAIIGLGYVGKAEAQFWSFRDNYEIIGYDPFLNPKDWISCPLVSKKEASSADLGVICVPTPSKRNGKCDISIVEETVKWLKTPLILIKSTIPPGTTDYLVKKFRKKIAFSPEFITETKFWSPYKLTKNPLDSPFYILGGKPATRKKIYELLISILGPSKDYYLVEAKIAEMAKYVLNAFFAAKVTFVNEIKKICDNLNLDYNQVRELWTLDPTVSKSHTAVFPDKPGFSGKCLPKDLKALFFLAKHFGCRPKLLEQIIKLNEEEFKSK